MTESLCPSSVRCSAPVAVSQSRTVSLEDADASSFESGDRLAYFEVVCESSSSRYFHSRFSL
jgi:hypothetical protein